MWQLQFQDCWTISKRSNEKLNTVFKEGSFSAGTFFRLSQLFQECPVLKYLTPELFLQLYSIQWGRSAYLKTCVWLSYSVVGLRSVPHFPFHNICCKWEKITYQILLLCVWLPYLHMLHLIIPFCICVWNVLKAWNITTNKRDGFVAELCLLREICIFQIFYSIFLDMILVPLNTYTSSYKEEI